MVLIRHVLVFMALTVILRGWNFGMSFLWSETDGLHGEQLVISMLFVFLVNVRVNLVSVQLWWHSRTGLIVFI